MPIIGIFTFPGKIARMSANVMRNGKLNGRKVTGMTREYIIKVDDAKTDIMGGTPLE